MRGIDLSNYALEDLLSFDDIFLDYFNKFLKNPAFPQPLQYNRYQGIFEEINPTLNSIVITDRLPRRFNATLSSIGDHTTSLSSNESEQNKVFDWVRRERLPLFFRTNTFREFKLCKLLVRPLEEERRGESIASSQDIGGYSRQTPQTTNTLSTEEHGLIDQDLNEDDGYDHDENDDVSPFYPDLERLNKYLFQRPGSRAFSVPAYFPFFSQQHNKLADSNKKSTKHRPPTASLESSKESKHENKRIDLNLVMNSHKTRIRRQSSIDDLTQIEPKHNSSIYSRPLTGKQTQYDDNEFEEDVNHDESESNEDGEETELPNKNRIDLLSIDDDVIDDLIDADRIHASINQYKLKYLGSVSGMHSFIEFLRGTPCGDRFVRFWLDCEFYRDSMQDYDQIENMATRNRLFRDIIEKYNFNFSQKFSEKIRASYENTNSNLSHKVFLHIQYDILRRLRSYWVPRYILNILRNKGKNYGAFPLPPLTPEYSRQSTYNTIPSTTKPSAKKLENKKPNSNDEDLTKDQKDTLDKKLRQAVCVDKDAGGPFLRFISINYPDDLPLVLFWYDVIDFNETKILGAHSTSRIQHALAIFNSYLSPTARFNIDISNDLTNDIRKNLSQTNTNLDDNLFEIIIDHIVPILMFPWLEFLKHDVTKYTGAKLTFLDSSTNQQHTDDLSDQLPLPEIEIEKDSIYINRSWIHALLAGQASEKPTMQLTKEQRFERAKRRKIMEIERRKALKAARLRKQLTNRVKSVEKIDLPLDEIEKQGEKSLPNSKGARRPSTFQSERSVFFDRMMLQNKSMMQLFRKHLVEQNLRETLNKFNFFLDAKQYFDIEDTHKRNIAAANLNKIYLDKNSKRNLLPLTDALTNRLANDLGSDKRGNGRPRTPFINAATREFRTALEDEFEKFCELNAKELGLSSADDFAALSQSELLVLLGDSYNPKDFDFEDEKGEGKAMPTKEDRSEFLRLLTDWSLGKIDNRFYAFYAHLTEHGKKDGLPFLANDVLFCLDAIRLKDISSEELLHQKCQVIEGYYLDSVIPPALQIDINHDNHQKLLKSLARILQSQHNSTDFMIFEDIRANLFKDILPYWSGFKQAFSKNTSGERALTKAEKMLKERLEEFSLVRTPQPSDFKLPPLSGKLKAIQANPESKSSLQIVFSLSTGIRYKDEKIKDLNNTNTTGANEANTTNQTTVAAAASN